MDYRDRLMAFTQLVLQHVILYCIRANLQTKAVVLVLKPTASTLWHYSCYSQSQTRMMHRNSKPHCISMMFCIAISL